MVIAETGGCCESPLHLADSHEGLRKLEGQTAIVPGFARQGIQKLQRPRDQQFPHS